MPIAIQNLHFRYEGRVEPVFDGLTLSLDDHWRLGLIGRNGRGKTTLLRLLAGQLDGGGAISATAAFSYFPFPVEHPHSEVRALLRELTDAEDWRIERELSLLSVRADALDRPFSTLSNGERTKVLLAALFLREGALPLIDEPTNHLDMEGRGAVSAYLSQKDGFILVSHDRDFLDRAVDHVLSLNPDGGVEILRGNFTSWNRGRERREAFERGENEKLRGEIKRLGEAARRAEAWSGKAEKGKHRTADSDGRPERGFEGRKAKKMMKRAKGIEDRRAEALERKSTLLRNIEESEPLSLTPEPYRAERLAALRGVRVERGGRAVLKDFNLEILRGERVALLGGNGAGKTTALKLLTGEMPFTGDVALGGGLKISYVPQDASFLRGAPRDFAEARGISVTQFLTILRKLGFSREQFEADMRHFSDGQKKKALLAASLAERAHLYIWDEPLNYVDIFSRMQLEELILKNGPTLLFVEHDRSFAERVATRFVEL